jgi:hypothetical protein
MHLSLTVRFARPRGIRQQLRAVAGGAPGRALAPSAGLGAKFARLERGISGDAKMKDAKMD